ncbi:YesL family protein [Gracilibacillus alcaliphilus]|uniref:YesL family protein n=1 Tax=Gracilibacillus alcaliphilus TaxID=1401441 RepID=UPI0019567BE7|nr:DUF624 domain-containing protein [Gracilibacillus alcaliphilus]MBM7676278.1 putative membrane protein YesL [Gracilibacillus alcaliphilus]
MNGIMKFFYQFGTWLFNIMYLQVLWYLFTAIGLGVLGVVPATLATAAVIHKWFKNGTDIPIFKEFWSTYKKAFIQGNGLGLIWVALGLFFYADYVISRDFIQSFYFHAFIVLVIVFYTILVFHFLIIYNRYELRFLQYFKQTFLIALIRPFESLAMLVALLPLYYLYNFLPVLIIFMGVPLTLYPILWFSYRACAVIEEKSAALQEDSTEEK